MTNSEQNRRFTIKCDSRVYSITAIKKAAYKLANILQIQISAPTSSEWAVWIETVDPSLSAAEAKHTFLNELLDQDLRETIQAETRDLRNLILAQAFSKIDLIGNRQLDGLSDLETKGSQNSRDTAGS